MSRQAPLVWLEFEEWKSDHPSRDDRDFFNMSIRLPDGEEYALNVWTFDYAARAREELREEQSPPLFTEGPDLIVEVADRPTLEAIADQLVSEGRLKEEWRVRR